MEISKDIYLSDIDNILEQLEENLSLEEKNKILMQIYQNNQILYNRELEVKKELEKISKLRSLPQILTPSPNTFDNCTIEEEKNNNESLDLDVSFYLEFIQKTDTLPKIKEILPNSSLTRYNDIINQILLELYKEIKEIIDLLHTSPDLEPDLKKDFLTELNLLQQKSHYIQSIYQEETNKPKKTSDQEMTNNKLVYLTTSSNNIYALSDLDDIDPSYYNSFKVLLNSIIDGSFKNFKSFTGSNDRIGTIYEVRGFKTRIIFDRLDNDTFIILQMLVKKTDNNLYYQLQLKSRCDAYYNQKDKLLSLCKHLDFLDDNQQITEEIQNILTQNARLSHM